MHDRPQLAANIAAPVPATLPVRDSAAHRSARLLQRYGSFATLVALVVIAGFLSPNFISQSNIRLQLQSFALSTALIAVGQTLVILTGGIDLSVGSLLAVGSCLAGALLGRGAPAAVALAVPVAVTTLIGSLSGTIIAKTRIQPIVVTLAVMIAARGVAQLISGDATIAIASENFNAIATTQLGPVPILGPIPISVVLAVAIYAFVAFLLARTVLGRSIFAVGGNERAARLSGIDANGVRVTVYAASGCLAGLAGVLYASYNSTADPLNDGLFFELTAIAAVVVGGTRLLGGVGGVWRTLVGGLILTVLYALFIQVGLPTPTQLIAQGVIIAAAVILQGGGES